MRKCIVAGRLHYFHKWDEQVVVENMSGMSRKTKALVEDVRTGEPFFVEVEDLKFVDMPDGEIIMSKEHMDALENVGKESHTRCPECNGKIPLVDGVSKCGHCGEEVTMDYNIKHGIYLIHD